MKDSKLTFKILLFLFPLPFALALLTGTIISMNQTIKLHEKWLEDSYEFEEFTEFKCSYEVLVEYIKKMQIMTPIHEQNNYKRTLK